MQQQKFKFPQAHSTFACYLSNDPPKKAHCATIKIEIYQLWDFIETWDFSEDFKSIVFCFLYFPLLPYPQKAHCEKTKIEIFQLQDFIEIWNFCEYLKLIVFSPPPCFTKQPKKRTKKRMKKRHVFVSFFVLFFVLFADFRSFFRSLFVVLRSRATTPPRKYTVQ